MKVPASNYRTMTASAQLYNGLAKLKPACSLQNVQVIISNWKIRSCLKFEAAPLLMRDMFAQEVDLPF